MGGDALGIPAHMGGIESVNALVDRTVEAFGRLDIVVNHAANALTLPCQALLDPAHDLGAGRWQLPSGPTIRLVSSSNPSGWLTCEVKDIDAARTFLGREDLLGNSIDDEVRISPAPLAGLDIRLVQATA